MKRILILYLLFFIQNSFSQTIYKQELDNYLDSLYANKKFMGSVSVFHKGQEIYSKSVGFSNVLKNTMNNHDTKFRIGSITKTFTATMIMKAVEEGKLNLDDKLSKFYPQIKNSDKITIDLLLRHRTGIYNFTENEDQTWGEQAHTEKEIIDYVVKGGSVFNPGEKYEYSNSNYLLLGFILEKIFNRAFNTILQEKICIPAGLKNTYQTTLYNDENDEAKSYNIQDKYIINENVNFSNNKGSGSIASTPTDLNTFLAALFNGKIISKNSLEKMLPKTEDYGYGIEKNNFQPKGYIHGGRVENYFSIYWSFPEEELFVSTFANATNMYPTIINDVLTRAAYRIKPQNLNFKKTNELEQNDARKLIGVYYDYRDKDATINVISDSNTLYFQESSKGAMFVPLKMINKTKYTFNNALFDFYPDNESIIVYLPNKIIELKKIN